MSFLNPVMLFGLAAIGVPIIVHLLNRRRVRRVVWAAMRFLQASIEQNQRRMKLEDLILLALRCLLVALLALALARPALQRGGFLLGTSKSVAIMLIDNSYSMDMSDGAQTRFDKARDAAEQVLSSFGAGSAAAVWFVSDAVQAPVPEPTLDLNLARRAIREGALSHRASDLLPALSKAVDALRARFGLRKDVYLFTDGQALGWQRFDEIGRLCLEASRELRLHVVLINEHETRNVAVSDLRLASGLAPVRHPLRFQVRVTNFGQEEARDIRVTLNVDAEAPADEFVIPNLAPGASQSVALFAKLAAAGFHHVTASVPRDRLRADDARQTVVRGIGEVRVLLVNGESGRESRDDETFFLEHALAPTEPESQARYFIQRKTIAPADLLSTRLNDFDAIVLANVPELGAQTAKDLQAFVRGGGGLMLFPGGRINTAFYNVQLAGALKLLPATFGSLEGDSTRDDKFTTLQDKGYQHPVVAIWGDPASGTLSSARFFQHYRLVPRADAPTQTVVTYSDASPAIVEWTVGLGRVFQFSSTADTAWNDWPVRPSFVPFIHRALGALVQRKDEGLNVAAGEAFVRRTANEFLGKQAIVRAAGETGPASEGLRVELIDESPTLRFGDTDRAGVYNVSIADPPLSEMFAVQANPSDSALEELSAKQLEALGQCAQVAPWSPDFSFRNEMEHAQAGAELWTPLLLVGIAIALTEALLGQWFSRST